MHVALSLPSVEARDLRAWVPPEHALVVYSAPLDLAGRPPPRENSGTAQPRTQASLLVLAWQAEAGLSKQKLQVIYCLALYAYLDVITFKETIVSYVECKGACSATFNTHSVEG